MKKIMPIISTIFVFLLNFDFVLAEFSYQPLSPLPDTTVSGKVTDLGTYITGIYKIAIGVAIILAVLSFIIAGLEWMTAEAVGKKEDAIKKINAALFGLLLTLGSWLFLNTINPATVNFNLKLDEVSVVGAFKPTLPGWYCKNADGYYSRPFTSAEECAKTGCENCEHIGAVIDDGGSGSGISTSYIQNGNYFDTTAPIYKNCPSFRGVTGTDPLQKCNIIYQEGPGWYYNYRDGANYMTRGPNTERMCEDQKSKELMTIVSYCYNVELGINDGVLNKILKDEGVTRVALDTINIKVSTSQNTEKKCEKVGETECTNVGGLNVKVVGTSLKNLKTECEIWAKKNKKGVCDITIVGATEWWPHGGGVKDIEKNETNHKPYYYSSSFGRTVDLRLDPVLSEFIKEKHNGPPDNGTLGKIYRFSGPTVVSTGTYLEELKDGKANHWHIEFDI